MIRIFASFCLAVVLVSCSKSVGKSEYINWVTNEEKGLKKEKTIGYYTFYLQYKPTEYVILSEHKSGNETSTTFNERKKDLEGMHYFDLTISTKNGSLLGNRVGSERDFNERLYYYSFGFQDDIKLVEGNDTLPCNLYHFIRSYDLKADKKFVLAFERRQPELQEMTILIQPAALNIGDVKMKIHKEDLDNIPELKL